MFYLFPAVIARARGHHDFLAIFFLNLLAGWTVIGWFIAFIWSLTAVRKPTPA
ncbi:superinfection immunity protein [Deferrisoma camini]|uniref:superinfection immunity protein n=1 Tax=Deferrisoma camini TaxID=1035120 RepID=UPI0004AF5773|nr:superinfection immunity protein [Deferrisoma camini]